MPESNATTIDKQSRMIVVRVKADRLDEANVGDVRSDVAAAGAESPQTPVVLDLSGVTFIPSLSLAGLIQLSQIFKSRSQRLVLIIAHPEVRHIFTLTRLDRLFEIHDDLSAVLGN